MEKLENLKDLLTEQLKDLYTAERIQLDALPVLQNHVSSALLKEAIGKKIVETQDQVARLETIFKRILNVPPKGNPNKSMRCLIEQAMEIISHSADSEVLDAAIITALQRIAHFEIVGYGTTCAYAQVLEEAEMAEILGGILRQEKNSDRGLTTLAREEINLKAKAPVAA